MHFFQTRPRVIYSHSEELLQAGEIVDEELNSILVHPLLAGVRLHCLIDACHSGEQNTAT